MLRVFPALLRNAARVQKAVVDGRGNCRLARPRQRLASLNAQPRSAHPLNTHRGATGQSGRPEAGGARRTRLAWGALITCFKHGNSRSAGLASSLASLTRYTRRALWVLRPFNQRRFGEGGTSRIPGTFKNRTKVSALNGPRRFGSRDSDPRRRNTNRSRGG